MDSKGSAAGGDGAAADKRRALLAAAVRALLLLDPPKEAPQGKQASGSIPRLLASPEWRKQVEQWCSHHVDVHACDWHWSRAFRAHLAVHGRLTKAQAAVLHRIAEAYVASHGRVPAARPGRNAAHTHDTPEAKATAEVLNRLLGYLKTHVHDVDNSLIGIQVATNLLKHFPWSGSAAPAPAPGAPTSVSSPAVPQASPGGGGSVGNSAATTPAPSLPKHMLTLAAADCWSPSSPTDAQLASTFDPVAETTSERLLHRIQVWSERCERGDGNQVMAEIQAFAVLVRRRGLTQMHPGDVFVCRKGDSVLYARFVKYTSENTILAHLDPEESRTKTLPTSLAFPLHASMRTCLDAGDDTMNRLVDHPMTEWRQRVGSKVIRMVDSMLVEQGLDMELMRRAKANETTLMDLFNVLRMLQLLDSLGAKVLPGLKESVQAYVGHERDTFQRVYESQPLVYLPLQRDVCAQLDNAVDELVAKAWTQVQQTYEMLNSALEMVLQQEDNILKEKRKGQLQEWWHCVVDRCVRTLLTQCGYSFTAMHPSYIDQPPRNFDGCKRNYAIVCSLIKGLRAAGPDEAAGGGDADGHEAPSHGSATDANKGTQGDKAADATSKGKREVDGDAVVGGEDDDDDDEDGDSDVDSDEYDDAQDDGEFDVNTPSCPYSLIPEAPPKDLGRFQHPAHEISVPAFRKLQDVMDYCSKLVYPHIAEFVRCASVVVIHLLGVARCRVEKRAILAADLFSDSHKDVTTNVTLADVDSTATAAAAAATAAADDAPTFHLRNLRRSSLMNMPTQSPVPRDQSVEGLRSLFDTYKTYMDSERQRDVSNLLKDLEYLERMEHLEKHPLEKDPHIVPISGLVMSNLSRKEKELSTIIEVWEHRMQLQREPSSLLESLAALSPSHTTTPSTSSSSASRRNPSYRATKKAKRKAKFRLKGRGSHLGVFDVQGGDSLASSSSTPVRTQQNIEHSRNVAVRVGVGVGAAVTSPSSPSVPLGLRIHDEDTDTTTFSAPTTPVCPGDSTKRVKRGKRRRGSRRRSKTEPVEPNEAPQGKGIRASQSKGVQLSPGKVAHLSPSQGKQSSPRKQSPRGKASPSGQASPEKAAPVSEAEGDGEQPQSDISAQPPSNAPMVPRNAPPRPSAMRSLVSTSSSAKLEHLRKMGKQVELPKFAEDARDDADGVDDEG